MSKLRILIALQRYDGGGAERQAAYLAEGLIKLGYDIKVLAFGKKAGLALEWFSEIYVETLSTGFSDRLLLDNTFNLKSWWLRYKYSRMLIHKVRLLKVDVIIPFTYPPNLVYGKLWRRMNVKKCFWNQRDEGRLFLGQPHEVATLNHVAAIISNSLAGKHFLEQFTQKQIVLIHNGIKVNGTSAPLNDEEIKIVMIANVHRYKDHLTLLKAWNIIVKLQKKVKLLLAGKEGDTAILIRDFISKNNIRDSVSFLGPVNDIPALLRTVHIGVFSSKNEGVPNGILECMAAGLPVVATHIDGSVEALGKDCPFLCASGNEYDLAEKLFTLIQNPELRTKVGQENYSRVQNLFSIERMIEHYVDLIENE